MLTIVEISIPIPLKGEIGDSRRRDARPCPAIALETTVTTSRQT